MDLSDIKLKLKKLPRTKFGISIPELRKLAKTIAKHDYKDFLDKNPIDNFELKLLHAFVIGYTKADIIFMLNYFEKFIPYVDDWCINDSLCQNFRQARKYPEIMWDFIMKYKNSKKEFESRIVSVIMLSHFLNDKYIDKVIDTINDLNTDFYYSKMGVAWLIATIMGVYPDKCLEYLKSDNCLLDRSTYNKALQKIRESFKVGKDIKKLTKNMRKY